MTPYGLLLQACGLSHREGADFHQVRLDTVKSWSAGRNCAPAGALAELRELHRKMERASRQVALALLNSPGGAEVQIRFPADDAEAQSLGLPCVGAWRAMTAMVLVRINRPVRLVPLTPSATSSEATLSR